MHIHDSSVAQAERASTMAPWRMTIASSEPGRVEIQVQGVLDFAAARRIIEALAHTRPTGIHVDLSGARQIEDRALAHLADTLDGSAPRVTIAGLGRHHHRLLRLLGREQMLEPANR